MTAERVLQAASNIICVAVGLLVGLAVADVIGETAVATVRDWQGLLGGVLAIAAAYLTVRQMRLSDDQHQIRHSEMIGAERSRERMIAKRAGSHMASDLRVTVTVVGQMRSAMSEEALIRNFFDHSPGLAAIHTFLQRVTTHRSLLEARPLFEPEMDEFLTKATQYVDATEKAYEVMRSAAHRAALTADHLPAARALLRQIDSALNYIEKLAVELDAMDRRYA